MISELIWHSPSCRCWIVWPPVDETLARALVGSESITACVRGNCSHPRRIRSATKHQKSTVLTVGLTMFFRHVATFDMAQFTQPKRKRAHKICETGQAIHC